MFSSGQPYWRSKELAVAEPKTENPPEPMRETAEIPQAEIIQASLEVVALEVVGPSSSTVVV